MSTSHQTETIEVYFQERSSKHNIHNNHKESITLFQSASRTSLGQHLYTISAQSQSKLHNQ